MALSPGKLHRIIPAHAGQTDSLTGFFGLMTDHPRACGANLEPVADVFLGVGSSPRMRGKRRGQRHRGSRLRIIPAHAGQTRRACFRSSPHTDHPRACGANERLAWFVAVEAGSSPRMRGKRPLRLSAVGRRRIIPAHAGQTSTSMSVPCSISDHPRACGANLGNACNIINPYGSSPRMRGKRQQPQASGPSLRIIPAHAGQTAPSAASSTSETDHPRACGANWPSGSVAKYVPGSSPRMRGKPACRVLCSCAVRIIPAHAGQTVSPTVTETMTADHPRACGANGWLPHAGGLLTGSSPRMRGKRAVRPRISAARRIIPAHAGQTP